MPVLQVLRHRFAPSASGAAEIELDCRGDGGTLRAALHCAGTAASAIGYAVEGAPGEFRLTGWLPRRRFRRLRQLLAGGGPVSLRFALRDRGARTGYLDWLALTGPGGASVSAAAHPIPLRLPAPMRRGPVSSRYAMPL